MEMKVHVNITNLLNRIVCRYHAILIIGCVTILQPAFVCFSKYLCYFFLKG